jgi:hypothetical protein
MQPTQPSDERDVVRVLLYSDDSDTRAAVRQAIGRRAAADLPPIEWAEYATHAAVVAAADAGGLDLMILDGEAVPVGGMGICRQLKNEVYRCPGDLTTPGWPPGHRPTQPSHTPSTRFCSASPSPICCVRVAPARCLAGERSVRRPVMVVADHAAGRWP